MLTEPVGDGVARDGGVAADAAAPGVPVAGEVGFAVSGAVAVGGGVGGGVGGAAVGVFDGVGVGCGAAWRSACW
jgi:hypothetical protein